MSMLVNILLVILSFVAMECVAWFTHKYVMHGFLWFLHNDHHQREDKIILEKNDSFFLIFATPGILCMYYGFQEAIGYAFWIGLGITIYGFAYFLVHDIFIHQRIKIFRNSNSPYLRAIRRAHKMHHKHLDRFNGECFGMLWVPIKYFRESSKTS